MTFYSSLFEALKDLQERGYKENFSVKANCLECNSLKLKLVPDDFTLDEVYRFEDDSSADNNSIVFAISSTAGVKGTIVDSYGVYAENLNPKMMEKLFIKSR